VSRQDKEEQYRALLIKCFPNVLIAGESSPTAADLAREIEQVVAPTEDEMRGYLHDLFKDTLNAMHGAMFPDKDASLPIAPTGTGKGVMSSDVRFTEEVAK
jgi:hypothetical protein